MYRSSFSEISPFTPHSINLPQYAAIINTNCYNIKEEFNTNRASINEVLGLFSVMKMHVHARM